MNIQHFSELIKHAGSILKLSHVNIENKYVDYPICIMKHIEKGMRQDIIEIRFDDQEAALSVTFDNENICNVVFIFADEMEDIAPLFTYLNNKYDYDYLKTHWLLSSCYMKVKEREEGIIFVFYC